MGSEERELEPRKTVGALKQGFISFFLLSFKDKWKTARTNKKKEILKVKS